MVIILLKVDIVLRLVDAYDIYDLLPAYGAERIGASFHDDCAVVAHTHVSTRVHHTVTRSLETHRTLVSLILCRFVLVVARRRRYYYRRRRNVCG